MSWIFAREGIELTKSVRSALADQVSAGRREGVMLEALGASSLPAIIESPQLRWSDLLGWIPSRLEGWAQEDADSAWLIAAESLLNQSKILGPLSASLVSRFVPIVRQDWFYEAGFGFSSAWCMGRPYIGKPSMQDAVLHRERVALNLAHEIGHQWLLVFQHADLLFRDDIDRPIYSPIRKTQRPAVLALHAWVASSFMLKWLQERPDLGDYSIKIAEWCVAEAAALKLQRGLARPQLEGLEWTPAGREVWNALA